jgi:hypothetical protein
LAKIIVAINSKDNISLTGLDWTSRLRELTLDVLLWQKLIQYHGNSDKALRWVQLQIKLFSLRHPEPSSLSHIISSIAFVEMATPLPATISGLPKKLFLDQAETKAR